MKNVQLLGFASGIGAGNPGTGDGPMALKNDPNFLNTIPHHWKIVIEPRNKATHALDALDEITFISEKLAKASAECIKNHEFFITLAGDHSSGIGTWSGAAYALRDQGDLGLIWIDAHKDAHTPETSESGNIHGMPVACLLGHGPKSLTRILDKSPKIKPENLCIIGTRSFEQGETDLLDELNVRTYNMPEVSERGFGAVFDEALHHVTQNTKAFGMSLDLDGLDPRFAPGVGTPVEQGVDLNDLLESLKTIKDDKRFIGFEIAEYNPHLDRSNTTRDTIASVIHSLC